MFRVLERQLIPQALQNLERPRKESGWDGFFLWDHLVEWNKPIPIYETFASLSAIAASTSRIRIGTSVSPLPKYKPWITARKTVALDQLSNGRLTLGVGIGAKESTDYDRFGETSENHVLGEKLDESLQIITRLADWQIVQLSRKTFHDQASRLPAYSSSETSYSNLDWRILASQGPLQESGEMGWHGSSPSARRACSPRGYKKTTTYVRNHRTGKSGFDVANIGFTTGVNPTRDREKIMRFSEAGMTWWLESMWTKRDKPQEMRTRIMKGPPA